MVEAELAELDISDANDDPAAAKKKEENRKKRERQKAKKAADKATGGDSAPTTERNSAQGRWQTGCLPCGRAERRDAGGGTRGLGVFALEGIAQGDVYSTAAPALSCIFDSACDKVCGFCFRFLCTSHASERVTFVHRLGKLCCEPLSQLFM